MKNICVEDRTVEYDDGIVSVFLNTTDDWRNRHMTLKMKLEHSYDNGYMNFAFQAVSNGKMNLNVAADMLGMSEEEFEKAMVESGYKVTVA